MTDFLLITGFLGSGKTSLVRTILKELSQSRKIAVIQNEFAPSGTDGKELMAEGFRFELTEINNGSVFCACQLGSFIPALEHMIHNIQADLIILEATGLADPVNIFEIISDARFRGRLRFLNAVCVVDPVNYSKGLKFLNRIANQIRIADVLLINKTDIFKGDLSNFIGELKRINPFALVLTGSFARVETEIFMRPSIDRNRFTPMLRSEGRPDIKVAVLKTSRSIRREKLQAFLNELNPLAYRVKGFLNTGNRTFVAVHSVFGECVIREADGFQGNGELIVLSENLSPSGLKNIFESYAEPK